MSAPTLTRLVDYVSRRVNYAAAAAFSPVDASSAAVFRVAFGTLALVAIIRFFINDWIDVIYVDPSHHIKYLWFDWVQPLPALGMRLLFLVLGVLAIGIAIGLFYRWCVALFCIGFLYVELLEATTYLNHYYWLTLTCVLMAFLPLNRKWSIDAWRGATGKCTTIPVAVLWLIRAQLAVVYIFGGIPKLNPDWLLNAMPMMIWLNQHGDYPIVGALLQQSWVAFAMSWSGAAFDLTIMMWMSIGATRRYAYAVLVTFHIMTWQLFPSLGMFPWLMIASTPIFFHPRWPQQVIGSFGRVVAKARRFQADEHPDGRRPPADGNQHMGNEQPAPSQTTTLQRLAVVVCAAVVLFQLAMPFRHWLYPGNVRWTEEGYRYSWRMMLSEKVGYVTYRVTDSRTGLARTVHPGEYLSDLQVERTAIDPDMILQTAHFISADYESKGYTGVEVRADAFVALNGGPYRRLIDPDTDLANVSRTVLTKDWVLRRD